MPLIIIVKAREREPCVAAFAGGMRRSKLFLVGRFMRTDGKEGKKLFLRVNFSDHHFGAETSCAITPLSNKNNPSEHPLLVNQALNY
jgi:hypothetical protein